MPAWLRLIRNLNGQAQPACKMDFEAVALPGIKK